MKQELGNCGMEHTIGYNNRILIYSILFVYSCILFVLGTRISEFLVGNECLLKSDWESQRNLTNPNLINMTFLPKVK